MLEFLSIIALVCSVAPTSASNTYITSTQIQRSQIQCVNYVMTCVRKGGVNFQSFEKCFNDISKMSNSEFRYKIENPK